MPLVTNHFFTAAKHLLIVACTAGMLLVPYSANAQIQAALARWLLGDLAAERAAVGAAARRAGTAEALAARGRFCVRPQGANSCHFTNADNQIEALSNALGPGHRIRTTSNPSIFEILDAANNVISIVEVLDKRANQARENNGVDQSNDGYYEVACGPGYAPSPYNSNPEQFSQWSCSNGGSYYNAAGACQPGKNGWRIWKVIGGRLQSVAKCDQEGLAIDETETKLRQSNLPAGVACGNEAMHMACPSMAIPGTNCRRCQ